MRKIQLLLAAIAALMLISQVAFAQEAELKEAAAAPAVVAELGEPDGASIDLSNPNNWKIFSVGTGTFDFNDSDDIRDATQEAILNAKAAMAKYAKERISTDEQMDRMVEKKKAQSKKNGQESSSVSKESMKTTLTSIRNSASAILTGVITLEVKSKWYGDNGEVKVKLGQSQKTVDAAKNFRNRTNEALRDSPGAGSGSGKAGARGAGSPSGSGHPGVNQKSNSDF